MTESEIFSLLGPSGCGKTTLLRIIAGFESPDSGSIIVDNKDITEMPSYKRPINMMFQNYALFPHMSLEKNIAFGLKQENLSKKEINQRVKEALDMVSLSYLAQRYPHQISGGEQQRTALARSIVKRPKILLLDEPLGALDRNTREKTQMELIKIQKILNITFIIVTHDQEEAMALSDRMAVMNDGKILQLGRPEEIYEYPNSKFVANFVGSINLFSGAISSIENKNIYLKIDDHDGDLIINTDQIYNKGQRIWIAIRPEELTIHSEAPAFNQNIIKGQIIDISFIGSQFLYFVELKNGYIASVSVPTAARSKNSNLAIYSEAYLAWHDSDGVLLTR